mmetsp:Transcript_23294/g.27332  ORF Transcript_23294/g.27332 Transcript_23294/m.27332 type:complete len:160 (+) Transcript_23294:1104-1583(+)
MRNDILVALATAGGFLGSAYLVMSNIFADYLSFTFDKSLMKRLYSQEREPKTNNVAQESGLKRTDQEEFLHRMKNRKPYTFGYFGYLIIRFSDSCCCCLSRWFGPRYQEKLKQIRRLEKSRQMLTAEKDIESFIMMRRMTTLLVKAVLLPHQQMAIPFF